MVRFARCPGVRIPAEPGAWISDQRAIQMGPFLRQIRGFRCTGIFRPEEDNPGKPGRWKGRECGAERAAFIVASGEPHPDKDDTT